MRRSWKGVCAGQVVTLVSTDPSTRTGIDGRMSTRRAGKGTARIVAGYKNGRTHRRRVVHGMTIRHKVLSIVERKYK